MSEESAIAEPALPERLLLYDGVCAFCNWSVKVLLRADRDGLLHYAALQGETAARLRSERSEIPEELSTLVYVENGRVYKRSRAVLRPLRLMPYPWRMISWLRLIPWPLSDLVYRLVARLRYRLFGLYDSCPLPPAEARDRFLP